MHGDVPCSVRVRLVDRPRGAGEGLLGVADVCPGHDEVDDARERAGRVVDEAADVRLTAAVDAERRRGPVVGVDFDPRVHQQLVALPASQPAHEPRRSALGVEGEQLEIAQLARADLRALRAVTRAGDEVLAQPVVLDHDDRPIALVETDLDGSRLRSVEP